MAEESANGKVPDLSSILGELLANQELMSKISNITAPDSISEKETHEAHPSTPTIDGLLSDPNILSKLPEVISVIKPIIGNSSSSNDHNSPTDKRLGLLIAMKPYLNSRRCEAIDYIAKMSKISDTIKGLKL